MHEIDKFRQAYHRFTPMGATSLQQVTDFAIWLRDDGISLFKRAFKQECKRPVPSLPAGQMIEQAYPKSFNELDSKKEQQAFYSANAQIFCETCTWISVAVANAHSHPNANVFASRHFELLRKLTADAMALMADWAANTQGTPGMYGVGKNPWHSALEISHATEQLIFGGSTFFAFADNATDAGTALLRVALETRVRFGFGLLGVLDKASQAVLPLNLSIVLKAIAAHESQIEFGVPLQHIERLYGWSNIYMHVGLKHFTWSPIFANRYLNPFLRAPQGSSSVNAGIRVSKATIAAVQTEAETEYKLDSSKRELLKLKLEHCSVVFKT